MTKSKWVALTRNQVERKTGEELFDLFDTCGQSSPIEWRAVTVKVLRSDAERILQAVNGEQFLPEDIR